MDVWKGKRIVLGISGSIAAYKMADLASALVKAGCDVHAVLTESAAKFITPATFEALTKNPCFVDPFEKTAPIEIEHISLGQKSDLILIAPASANVIARLAHGIADDMLTCAVVARTCPVLLAPAMNTHMYQNPMVQDNLNRLRRFGFEMIEPESGRLACASEGVGKLPDKQVLLNAIEKMLSKREKDLEGLRILVTAGPTREPLDPVRYITNHSSGRMGYAIAKNAKERGAVVTLVTGPVELLPPEGIRLIGIETAQQMYEAVMEEAGGQDIIIKAAAVADYRPKQASGQKIKKKENTLMLELERTKDILKELGEQKGERQCICGFSMETEDLIKNSKEKLKKKQVDMIAANSICDAGSGFGTETNHLILLTEEKEEDLGLLDKEDCASELLTRLKQVWEKKGKKR